MKKIKSYELDDALAEMKNKKLCHQQMCMLAAKSHKASWDETAEIANAFCETYKMLIMERLINFVFMISGALFLIVAFKCAMNFVVFVKKFFGR